MERSYDFPLGTSAARARDGAATGSIGREDARRRAFLGIAGLLLLLAALITPAIILGRLAEGRWSAAVHALDYAAAVRIHALQSPIADVPLWSLSWIGEMIPMALLSGAFFAYLMWRGRKASAEPQTPPPGTRPPPGSGRRRPPSRCRAAAAPS